MSDSANLVPNINRFDESTGVWCVWKVQIKTRGLLNRVLDIQSTLVTRKYYYIIRSKSKQYIKFVKPLMTDSSEDSGLLS